MKIMLGFDAVAWDNVVSVSSKMQIRNRKRGMSDFL